MSTQEITILDRSIIVEITYYHAGYQEKINALPEDCYPAEPTEIDFIISPDNEDAKFLQMILESDPNLYEKIEEILLNQVE